LSSARFGSWWKGVRALLRVLVALLVLGVAGVWLWAGSEGSLQWTLKQLARYQPLTAEDVRGSLRSGLQVKQLRWERDGLKIEAFDARLEWQPLFLLGGTFKLNQASAARLRIEDRRPPRPSVIPISLVMALRVAADEVSIAQLEWVAGGNTFTATDLAGNYSYDGLQHKLRLDSLRWAGGSYSAQGTLGAHGTLPVDARLEGRFETDVPGTARKLPLSFSATLRGPVADMQASALLQTRALSPTAITRATGTARITPWAAQPVPQAQADFRQLDIKPLWPQAPRTSLTGQVQLQPAGTSTWALNAQISNELPGPWDQGRVPVERLNAAGEWRPTGQALVRSLEADIGGGRVQATGEWRGSDGWVVQGELAAVNAAAVYSTMAPLPLGGRADLKGEGKSVSFEVELKTQAVKAAPGKAKSELAETVRALELRQVLARGRWADGTLSLPMLDVRSADASLRAALELQPALRVGRGRVFLEAPGLKAQAEGELDEAHGGGTLRVSSANLAQAVAWLGKLPGAPAGLRGQVAGGRGEAQLAWQGGWHDPALQGTVNLPLLQLPSGAAPASSSALPAGWSVREVVATLNGRLSDASLQARGRAELGQRRLTLDLSGRGGRRSQTPAVWQGTLATLNFSASDLAMGTGTWTLGLRRAFDLRWSSGSFDAGAGEALLAAPVRRQADRTGDADAAILAWEPVRWRTGELRTAGRLNGLPLAWIELIGGPQLAGSALSGDMVFDAQWDASLGATPRLRASLARNRGDVTVLAETAEGSSARVRAGVRDARLSLTSEGEAVMLTLRWDSERGGTADGELATRLARGGAAGWHWPDSAPLAGKLRAQLPRIGVWSLLAPPGWRLRGSLVTDIAIAGTRADPQLSGALAADDLALRSVVDGIELQNGRLRGHLDGRRLLIDEFVLRGPGTADSGGTLVATGEGSWTAGRPQARMAAQVTRLRASIRSDRQLTVSGTIAARHDAGGTVINGNLRADQARILLPEETTPKLGDDVAVRGATGPVTRTEERSSEQAARPPAQRLTLAVDLDLGDDFRVQGLGIDTRLRGTLALSGQSIASPRLVGTIQATGGEYQAYGQRLNIERGVVRFTGPIDNPSMDILAIRPNLVQRVGVQVTGPALAPFVRLYSEPDMADVEKLSWLVTGRASASGGAEAALVQQAALALLASRSGAAGKRGIAGSLGLDELSFKREGADGPSITLGKRFGRNFYAAYERSLAGALGTLYIFYDLTQRFTLRAQAGERTAVDLIYTFTFD
jgi:translocation and assembly module TamB